VNTVTLPVVPLADVPLLSIMPPDVPLPTMSPDLNIADPAGPVLDTNAPSPVLIRIQPPATPALLVWPAEITTFPPTAEFVEPTRTERPPDRLLLFDVRAPVLNIMLPLPPDNAVPDWIRMLPDVLTELTPVVKDMEPVIDPLAVGDTT
jgi:hypothetical protein